MKKFSIVTTALILAAAILAGCAGAPAKELTRGTIEDNVYTSEYAELKYTAPEGWTFSTDEVIAQMAGVSADRFTEAGMPVSEEMLKLQAIYDMMSVDNTTGSNVIIMYENLSVSLLGVLASEESYLDQAKSALEKAKLYNYEFGDVTEQKIGSNTYKVMPAVMVDYGAVQYYCIRKIDKYMLCIIITSAGGDDLSSYLPSFS